jgi:putative thioredoxin
MQNTSFIFDVDEAGFEQDVIERSREVPVVVDFWAPWCGPCRMISPVLERLTEEGRGQFVLVKVNVDENPGISMRYGVQGIPAVKGFHGGKVVAEFVGAQPEPMVRQFLKKLVPSEADRLLVRAEELLSEHRWAEAEQAYRETLAQGGEARVAAMGLLKALLAQGKRPEASALLDRPPGDELLAAERYRPLLRLLEAAESAAGEGESALETGYRTAGEELARGNHAAAMEALLAILRRDKRYRQGDAHKALLAIFELLGEHHETTREYRNRLAQVLF